MDLLKDPAKLKARSAYNAAADHFDDTPLGFWARTGAGTIQRLALVAGATVLDVGCGSGASAIPAAQAVGPSGHVVGVDLADRLLDRAREKSRHLGLGNIAFRHADMESLDYSDGDFDAVVSVFSVFFVPDMTKQIAELWRMVKPGGELAITTWGPNAFEPAVTSFWAAVKMHAEPRLHFGGFNPWDRITTVAAVGELLTSAGVVGARIEEESSHQALRSPEDWWTVVSGSGFVWTVDQMGRETAERVRRDNLAALQTKNVSFIETNAIYAVVRKEA